MTHMLAKHSAIYLCGRVLPAMVNLLATFFFTHHTAPSEYGIYILIIALAQIGSAAGFQWLRLSLLRFMPKHESNGLLPTLAWLYAVQAALVVMLSLLAWFILPIEKDLKFWLAAVLMILAQAWFDLQQERQRSALQPANYGYTFGLRAILSLVLGGLAAFYFESGLLLAGTLTVSLLLTPLPLMPRLPKIAGQRNPTLIRQLLKFGLPLALTQVFITTAGAVDKILLSHLLDSAATGLYGSAFDLTRQIIFVFIQALTLASYPLITRALENEGVAAAQPLLQQNFTLLITIALPLTAWLIALQEPIITTLLGPAYQATALNLLPLLATSAMLLCIRSFYFDNAFQWGQRTWLLSIIALLNLAMAVGLSLLLIPRFGLWGAACSSFVTQSFTLIISAALGRKVFKLPLHPQLIGLTVIGCCISTGLMHSILLLTQSLPALLQLALAGSFGAGLYLAYCFWLNIGDLKNASKRLWQQRIAS